MDKDTINLNRETGKVTVTVTLTMEEVSNPDQPASGQPDAGANRPPWTENGERRWIRTYC